MGIYYSSFHFLFHYPNITPVLGLRVMDLGFRPGGCGLRVWDSGLGVTGVGGLGLRIDG